MNGLLAHLDVGRALLALLISVVLFAVVRGEENPTNIGSFDVPVEILDRPPGLVIVESPSNPTARIAVSAPRELWPGLRPDNFRAVASLSSARVGTGQYRVDVDHPDPRVGVLSVSPSEISVRLDQEVATTVPVRLDRGGSVPAGYEAGEAEIDPINVAITGPAAIVKEIAGVAVGVRLDGVTVDVDGRYTPNPIDAEGQTVSIEGRGVLLTPPAVRVRIPVAQQLGYRTVGVQPHVVGVVQSGFVIEGVSAEPSAVTIVGAPRALSEVNFAQTEEVDVSDVNTTLTRQVSVVVPDGVSVVQQGTARVT
ncbi:MAG: hypothetical protein GEU73_17165, partial [Chloroflexi bacterium]|nr:hypothetical protein [Chloroflexota bacterium]